MVRKSLLILIAILTSNYLFSQIITTVAGNGISGFNGDGIPATAAELYFPEGIAFDKVGNLYIADSYNSRIRKIDTLGIITTVAGTGSNGFNGDGGLATAAQLYFPSDVAFDSYGNMYICDTHNDRIRKVNTSGIISTVAGNGFNSPNNGGFAGDGGYATSAELYWPGFVKFDMMGNMYISDDLNDRIRKVNTAGIITTVAGAGNGGYVGNGGVPATTANLTSSTGTTTDGMGNLYISDGDFNQVKVVDTSGIINAYAGNSNFGSSGDGGTAILAELAAPLGLAFDFSNNLYVADNYNSKIRQINSSGIITTIAGSGSWGYSGDSGLATLAKLNQPFTIAFDKSGNLYISDEYNHRIRKVTLSCTSPVLSIAGSGKHICKGDSVTLNAYGAFAYSWASINNNSPIITISPPASTTYTLLAATGTCTASKTATIIVNPLPIITVTGNDSICKGSTSLLSATGAVSYNWVPNNGLNNVNTANVLASPFQTQTYNIIGQDVNNCIDSASFKLNVIPLPQLQIIGTQSFCIGQTTQLTASGADQYVWSPIIGLTNTTGSQVTTSVNSNTTYNIVGINNGMCKDSISIPITVFPLPTVSLSAPDSICQGQEFKIAAMGNGDFSWSTASGLSCTQCSNPDVILQSNTQYIVTITDVNSCTNKDSILIKINPSCGNIVIPNIFSPNGDGINDLYSIKADNIQSFQFEIFDRWGNKIFESTNSNEWNGKNKTGEPCSEGTYFYIIRIQKYSGENKDYKGFLTLVK